MEWRQKRLELLHELVPGDHRHRRVRELRNCSNADAETERHCRRRARVPSASNSISCTRAAKRLRYGLRDAARLRRDALLIGTDAFFNSRGAINIVALARSPRDARHLFTNAHALPAAGGFMSYGTNLAEPYRQVGIYTGP